MKVNTKNLISISEANQNFFFFFRLVDENGPVVILKNNTPRYLLIKFDAAEQEEQCSDEDLLNLSNRLIEKNRKAYEVLAE